MHPTADKHSKVNSRIGNMAKKISCFVCDKKIIQYYNESYKGDRGKCLSCGSDFPLE